MLCAALRVFARAQRARILASRRVRTRGSAPYIVAHRYCQWNLRRSTRGHRECGTHIYVRACAPSVPKIARDRIAQIISPECWRFCCCVQPKPNWRRMYDTRLKCTYMRGDGVCASKTIETSATTIRSKRAQRGRRSHFGHDARRALGAAACSQRVRARLCVVSQRVQRKRIPPHRECARARPR